MHYQPRIRGIAWTTAVAGALMLSACSSSNNGDGSVNKDATGNGADTGNPNGGDAGTNADGSGGTDAHNTPDTGIHPDAGPRQDGSTPDTGVDMMMNAEGH